MKLWQSASAALVALLFWIFAVSLPQHFGAWAGWVVWLVGVAAGLFIASGVIIFGLGLLGSRLPERLKKHLPDGIRGEVVFLGFYLFFSGVLMIVAMVAWRNGLDLSPGQHLALGVGGSTVAAFVFAATQLDTTRAAASVAVVVLLIGVTTWPDAKGLIDPSVQKALITWMGVILGVNGVAEAAQQTVATRAKADKPGTRAAQGDLAGRAPDPAEQPAVE